MELSFLGRGSAFNPNEGNTSAFFIEGRELFLIDCGENIFGRLLESRVLEGITAIYLFITHTHSDHVGSLGSLISYAHYKLKVPFKIVLPNRDRFVLGIRQILEGYDCYEGKYSIVDEKSLDNKLKTFQNVRYMETAHCHNLCCYGLLFNTPSGVVYYSGDSSELNLVKGLIASKVKIDRLYLDITTEDYPGNVHLNINILEKTIPLSLRNRVWCMHFNDGECIQLAQDLGFNVVETIGELKEFSLVNKPN